MGHGGRFDSPDERDACEAKVAQRAEAEERRADEFIEEERHDYVAPPERERFVMTPERAAFEMEQAKNRYAAKSGPGEPVVADEPDEPPERERVRADYFAWAESRGHAAPRPSKRQVAGQHYADLPIQPSEFIHRNGLGWCEGNAIKYISRHKRKGGREDIQKAIHYLELLLEWDYGND